MLAARKPLASIDRRPGMHLSGIKRSFFCHAWPKVGPKHHLLKSDDLIEHALLVFVTRRPGQQCAAYFIKVLQFSILQSL